MAATFIGGEPAALTGTTWLAAVAAPASGKQREVLALSVWNRDTVQHTVKARKKVGANTYEVYPPLVLAAGARGRLSVEGVVLDATTMTLEVQSDATATTTEPLIDVSVFEVP